MINLKINFKKLISISMLLTTALFLTSFTKTIPNQINNSLWSNNSISISDFSSINLNDFTRKSNILDNGSPKYPKVNGARLDLTSNEDMIASSIFSNNLYSLNSNPYQGFASYYQVNVYSGADGLADGFSFVISTTQDLGATGGARGYSGVTGQFSRSLSFYINTHLGLSYGVLYNNSSSLIANTDINSIYGVENASDSLNTFKYEFHIWVRYDQVNKKLTYEAYREASRQRLIFTQTVNLASELSSSTYLNSDQYYVGFTAGTGSATAIYSVLNWQFTNQSTNTQTVTLNQSLGNGGSTQVIAHRGYQMPVATAPTRTGYIFGGYFSAQNGAGNKYYNSDMTSSRNFDLDTSLTLYAKWIPDFFSIRDFTGFRGDNNDKNLDEYPAANSLITPSFGVVDLTNSIANQAGALYYRDPFKLNDQSGRKGFSTYYELKTYRVGSNPDLDHGVYFFISRNNNQIGDAGSNMGYLNSSGQFNQSVGFYIDIFNGVNVGISANGTTNLKNVDVDYNQETSPVHIFHIWIDYDDVAKRVVFEGYQDLAKTVQLFRINESLDLRTYLNASTGNDDGQYYTGFTAGTSSNGSFIVLLGWDFENESDLALHDSIAPTIPTISIEYNSDPTKYDLTLSGSTDINNRSENNSNFKYQYSFNNSTWVDYTSTVTFNLADNANTIYARAVDNYGNISSVATLAYKSTLTFNTGGGDAISSVTKLSNTSYTLPNPTYTGRNFLGWFSDLELTTPYNESLFPNSNKTIYAKWEKIPYSATINFENGTTQTITVYHGDPMPAISVSKTGYTLIGIFDAETNGNKYYNNDLSSAQNFDLINHEVQLYPRFQINTYTISINDGLGNTTTNTQNYGTLVAYPGDRTFSDYLFLGWYIDGDLSLPYDFTQIVASNLLIKAKWGALENEKVYFNNGINLNDVNSNYANATITFTTSDTSTNVNFVINSNSANQNNLGVISVDNGKVYIGTGTGTRKQIANIHPTENGLNGNDLKLTIIEPLASFPNGDFKLTNTPTITYNQSMESNYLQNWTIFNKKYTPADGTSETFFTYRNSAFNSATYTVTRESQVINNVTTYFMRLKISGTVNTSSSGNANSAFGPYIESDYFSAGPTDSIQFEWKAAYVSDWYHVLAYLIVHDAQGNVLNTYSVLKSSARNQDNFDLRTIQLSSYLSSQQNYLKFRFVGGSYDETNGTVLGAQFDIKNFVVKENNTPGTDVQTLIRNVQFISEDNNPTLNNSQTLTLTTTTALSPIATNIYTKEISIVPVNDLPTHNGTVALNFAQNASVNFNLNNHFADPDSSLVFSGSNLPPGLTLNQSGVLSGILTNDDVGIRTVSISADDGLGPPLTINYTLTVTNVNDVPLVNQIVALNDFEIRESFNNTYVLPDNLFYDIDIGDSISYSFISLPTNVTFNSGTKTLTVNSSFNFSTLPLALTIKGTDSGGLYATRTLNLIPLRAKIYYFNGTNLLEEITATPGSSLTLSTLSPTGYYVDSWYTDQELTNIFNSLTIPEGVTELYGKFIPINYSITYLGLENGSNNINNPASYNIETQTFQLLPGARDGYTFGGWHINQDYSDISTTQINSGTIGNIVLYAKWNLVTYTITYHFLEGITLNNPSAFNIVSSTRVLNEPTSAVGKTFVGFFDNPSFTGTRITEIPQGSFGNKNLYAYFFYSLYYLKFYDGDELIAQYPLIYQSSTENLTPELEKEGYTFKKWSQSIPATMPDRNIDVYAEFEVNEYTLTIVNTATDEIKNIKVKFGTNLVEVLPDALELEGYTLVGYDEVEELMPAIDLEVKLLYEINKYNLVIKNSLGDIIKTELLDYNSDLSDIILTADEIKGYTFDDWSQQLPSTMPANDLEIIANYTKLTEFNLTFIGLNNEVLFSGIFNEGDSLSSLNIPNLNNNPGIEFTGWDQSIPGVMPPEDLIIKATGTLRFASISLIDNNSLYDLITSNIGQVQQLPILSKIGYKFEGWLLGNTPVTSLIVPTNDLILTALWTPKDYRVNVTVGPQTIDLVVKFGQPLGELPRPQLFGFRFDGWKNEISGNFISASTIFNDPNEIKLVPIYTRLNATETLIALPSYMRYLFNLIFN